MSRFLFILVIFFFPLKGFTQGSIIIIDIDYIIKESTEGKKIKKIFEDKNSKLINEFKIEEKNLIENEKKILSRKNLISENEYKNEVEIFKKKIVEYNNSKKKKLENAINERDKNYKLLLSKINDILISYSKEKNIDLVLDKKNVLITKNQNDITSQILEILNR
jgi:outer membrane protein